MNEKKVVLSCILSQLLVGFLAAKAKDSNREKRRKLDKNIFHT